jgi:hypothetical protein
MTGLSEVVINPEGMQRVGDYVRLKTAKLIEEQFYMEAP